MVEHAAKQFIKLHGLYNTPKFILTNSVFGRVIDNANEIAAALTHYISNN